ncbi:MAG: ComEC/Rec2 family competence protein, partial [Candidatus Tagabacteria bacterium]
MNKLFATLLLGFCGGVVARSFFDFGWSFAVFFVFLGLVSAGIFIFLKFPKFVLFAGLFFFAFGLGILRYEIKETGGADFENKIGSKITIQGVIIEEPEEKENYTRLIIEENETKNKILLVSRNYPAFHYGDKIEINSTLEKPENFSESDFNWPAYLAKDDIYYEMFYPQIKFISGGGGAWIKRQLFSIKEKFIENLSAIIPEPNSGYLAGLTIGGKKALPRDLQEEFRKTGVIHIVVLSGYNVTIVAYAIMKILSFLPQIFGMSLGMLGILLFALMAGASATVVRASIMAVLVLIAKATGRIYQITIALLAAGFLMILHNPKILRFDASFQLSFLSTLALIYVSPIFEKKLSFVPKKFQLREISSATISTQIFVLPFILYQMGLFSAVALPVNLLILIFVPITMFFGFLSGGIGFISHFLAIPFGWLAYALSSYELWIVNIFSKLPFAAFNISISFWLMLLIYIIYAIIFFKNKK